MLIFQSLLGFAQKWDHLIGFPNVEDGFLELLESYDNGYLLMGASEFYSYNWLIKTNINGELIWSKSIIHNTLTLGTGEISQNSSGEIAIARCFSFPNGEQWPSITKLDECGNKVWCRTFIDDNYMHGCIEDVIIFDNGDILALAWLESLEQIDKIFLYYVDSNGNLLWRNSYASKNNHPLVLDRLGTELHHIGNNYYLVGWCYYPYPINPNIGYIRPFFVGIDSMFNEQWILPYGVNDTIVGKAYSIIQLNDSTLLGVGTRYLNGSVLNSILMKFNIEGELIDYQQVKNVAIGPDIKNNQISKIAQANDSLFIASAVFGPNTGENPFGELIVDKDANVFKHCSRPNTTGLSDLIKTFDNKYVIGTTYTQPNSTHDIYLYKINDSLEMDTVYPGNFTYDSLCPYQIESGNIDVSDCMLITEVGETPTPAIYYANLNTIPIKVYPNPADKRIVNITFQNTGYHKDLNLECYNVHGKLVHSEKLYKYQGESKLNIQEWQSGMYIALVFSKGQILGKAKFLVR